ncbi:unnamed protein product [Cercospora beticola]|nr:unnamed protein product [Cercospora beticola]
MLKALGWNITCEDLQHSTQICWCSSKLVHNMGLVLWGTGVAEKDAAPSHLIMTNTCLQKTTSRDKSDQYISQNPSIQKGQLYKPCTSTARNSKVQHRNRAILEPQAAVHPHLPQRKQTQFLPLTP